MPPGPVSVAGCWIVDGIHRCQGAEVSSSLGTRRYSLLERRSFDISQKLIVPEDKHLILSDRTTYTERALIPVVRRNTEALAIGACPRSLLRERVGRKEGGVLIRPNNRTMKVVSPRLCDILGGQARRVSEFRIDIVGGQLDF